MLKITKKQICENIKNSRVNNKMSQEDLALYIGRDKSYISRLENGETLIDTMVLLEIADVLNISVSKLLELPNADDFEDSKNLFGTDTLYVYYRIPYNNKKGKFIFKLKENANGGITVEFTNSKDDSVHMLGRLRMNDDCAIFVFDNYIPVNPNMDVTEVIVNIKYAPDELYMGCLMGTTEDGYDPSTRKILVSKKDVEFTDEIYERLAITEKEIQNIKEKGYWEPDIKNKKNY